MSKIVATILATTAGKVLLGTTIAAAAVGGLAATELPDEASPKAVEAVEGAGTGDDEAEDEETEELEVEEVDEVDEADEVDGEENQTQDLEEGISAQGEESSAFGQCVSDFASTTPQVERETNPAEECADDHPRQDGEATAAEHRQNGEEQESSEADVEEIADAEEVDDAEVDDEDDDDGPSDRGAEASAAGQARRP